MTNFNILSIFPEFFDSFSKTSIIRSAIENKVISINNFNIRDYTKDKHKMTDDTPYGGGSGMLMKAEPILACLADVKSKFNNSYTILLTPQGRPLKQDFVRELSHKQNLNLLCARYEGYDERIIEHIDLELSIGDYILSGGEPAAIVLLDAIARNIDGVLGNDTSLDEESFSDMLLEYPQYTRPEIVPCLKMNSVPKVLLSGNHAEIKKWRRLQSIIRTQEKRPDLITEAKLNPEEKKFLDRYINKKLSTNELEFLKGN